MTGGERGTVEAARDGTPAPSRPDSPATPARRAGLAQFELEHPLAITVNTEGASIDPAGSHPASHEPGINLPNHDKVVAHISLDIGGSLTKVVYFSKNKRRRGGRLHFEKFQTAQLIEYLDKLAALVAKHQAIKIVATGGGAYKFYDEIKQRLGVEVERADEMECLINGAVFFAQKIPQEIFTYTEERPVNVVPAPTSFPWLLVNIGSGVGMLKIDGPGRFERIGGSSLGGGTLWGLLSMLTPAKSYDEMLSMAATGDNKNVDMLVGDIYGADYPRIGLKASTIASSFGKVFKEEDKSRFDPADISRSLLYTISNNIGQLAYLHARYHGIEHIFFGGSYIRGHPQTIHTLAYAIKFWSQSEKTAYFFRHEGFLGALGAFIDEKGDIETVSDTSSEDGVEAQA